MVKFALLALSFSLPALADSISAQPQIVFKATIGTCPSYTGMFEFAAWGYADTFPDQYQGTTPTTFSYKWDQTFAIPASPTGDYFEVTRINTVAVYRFGGAIVIDGQSFNGDGLQIMDLSPPPYPDPNMYKPRVYTYTQRMDLTGPIDIHVYGSFSREYDRDNCCGIYQVGNLDANGFEQWLQIERFQAGGTPDPFAPEPASFGLVCLALLPLGWMLRRRPATR